MGPDLSRFRSHRKNSCSRLHRHG